MKRKLLTLFICAMMVLNLIACGEESTYDPGSWNEDLYVSNWLGLKYRLPDNVYKITDDEVYGRRFLYSGVFYGESDEPDVADLEDVVTIEMGACYLMDSYAIWIVTEEIPDDDLTIDDWIDEYMEMISNEVITFTITSDTPDVAIGDQTFREVKLHSSAMGVHLYQDIYITQKEGRIVYILVEYGGQMKDDAPEKLMSGLNTF